MQNEFAAVLFADIAGSTAYYQNEGDFAAYPVVRRIVRRIERAVEQHDGRVIKLIGDEVMARFSCPESAVVAALAIRADIQAFTQVHAVPLGIKISLHWGEVIAEGEDVHGNTVNLAARLIENAIPGDILTTPETVAGVSLPEKIAIESRPALLARGFQQAVPCLALSCPPPAWQMFEARLACGAGGAQLLGVGQHGVWLGRQVDCDVVVKHPLVSPRHARLDRTGNGWYLIACGLNGVFIRQGTTSKRVDGALQIGSESFEFSLGDRDWQYPQLQFSLDSRTMP